jgi:hypothetical protein
MDEDAGGFSPNSGGAAVGPSYPALGFPKTETDTDGVREME